MSLTATSRIEGIAILQHHDLVTGEGIVGANHLEERHRAPRRSATRPHRAGRPPGHTAVRGCPPELNASRERGGTQTHTRLKGAPSGAPIVPASTHTAARIHRNPGRRAGRMHRATAPGHQAVRCSGDRTEQHADQDRVHTEQDTFSSTHPVRRRFKTLRQDHRQRPARAQTPSFRNAPSTATSRAASTRRVRCPLTPAHRAVLAPGTTYSPHAPSRPRPPSATPTGMILTRTSRIEEQAHTAVPPRHRDR